MLEFFGIIAMSLLITFITLTGGYCGFKIVDILTNGSSSKILK
tara:strand:- start:1119 stop:1247 length:129 start_codon:yes stop_codon:yes gene_type:complete